MLLAGLQASQSGLRMIFEKSAELLIQNQADSLPENWPFLLCQALNAVKVRYVLGSRRHKSRTRMPS
jgi:hypothetical protein